MNGMATKKLGECIEVTAKDCKTFIHYISSNGTESSKNLIHRSINFEPRSYQAKADLTLAIQNRGEIEIGQTLFEKFNLSLNEEQQSQLKERIQKNSKQNEKKAEKATKDKRVANKTKWTGSDKQKEFASTLL
jgi:hypothetical protein